VLPILAGALALSLVTAGWGGSSPSTATGQHATPSGDPISIGVITPLSAPGDIEAGKQFLDAAKAWAKYVNQKGGILGRPVTIETGDDKGTPDVAASEARRLITQKKVVGITGQWTGDTTQAEMPVVQRYNVPLVVPYAWSDELTGKNLPQVFRVGPYNSVIAGLFAPYLRHKSYRRVTLFADSSDYAQGFAKALKATARGKPDIKVVNYEAKATDLTPSITAMMSQPPDAIVIAASFASRNLIINQARQAGFKGDIVAGWDYTTTPDYWKTTKSNGVGVVYPTFFVKGALPLTKTGKAVNAQLGAPPLVYQYLIWDSLNAVKWAIDKTKSVDPAKLVSALPHANFQGTMGRISFTNKRGTVNFHQWLGFSMFFKKMTAVGQTDTGSKLVFSVRPADALPA
jgi:ABC-type branched-subunit amino acid transport system substrate-binding protein